MRLLRGVGAVVDTMLDRSVVAGYSRVGAVVRPRLPGWPVDPHAGVLRGRTALVTGATSGLGLATAKGLAALGARTIIGARDPVKGERVAAEIAHQVPGADLDVGRCDIGDLDDVARFAAELNAVEDRLDILVHNAGVMPPERTESPQGHELSMAVHLLGPMLLTERLLPLLTDRVARVLFVSSGGMYTQGLPADPEFTEGDYSPPVAYARSKRVQVELLPRLQGRWDDAGVRVYATHPGWADTPGVSDSLPTFRRLTSPILRDADQGSDTTVWLSAARPAPPGGGLWHDRRPRPTHYLWRTRPDPDTVDRVWDWALQASGLPATPPQTR